MGLKSRKKKKTQNQVFVEKKPKCGRTFLVTTVVVIQKAVPPSAERPSNLSSQSPLKNNFNFSHPQKINFDTYCQLFFIWLIVFTVQIY